MKRLISVLTIFLFSIASFSQETGSYQIQKIYEFNINSTINPAIFNYLKNGFKKVSKEKNQAVLIHLNTPGGLVSTTKDILHLFGEHSFPIIIWVNPEGSSATSAGALISSGAHFLFMSDSTNIGAATPISSSGENIDSNKNDNNSDLKNKAINDLVALTKSYAQSRGRDYRAYEEMISQAKSFPAKEAMRRGAIDSIINTKDELQNFLKNKEIQLQGKKVQIKTSANINFINMPLRFVDNLLNVLSHPQLAYILFMIGAALLYFELQAPGGFIAGSLGAIFLVIAAMGFSVLPINLGALALIGLSLILFVLEIYIVSFGLLSIGAIASLLFGSLLLFDTPDSLIQLDRTTIYSTVISVSAVVILFGYYLFKESSVTAPELFAPINQEGYIVKKIENDFYQIKVDGQIWKVSSSQSLNINDKVKVISNKDLVLQVSKI